MHRETIYKYPLEAHITAQKVLLPKNAEILSAGVQGNETINIWVKVDPNEPVQEERQLLVFPTGGDIYARDEVTLRFINTVQLLGGRLIFHVFEEIEE